MKRQNFTAVSRGKEQKQKYPTVNVVEGSNVTQQCKILFVKKQTTMHNDFQGQENSTKINVSRGEKISSLLL